MVANANEPKFEVGQTVATPGALKAVGRSDASFTALLMRHVCGDWGDLSPEDARANDEALTNGDRILSAYVLSTGVKVWVITEADRSSTCILLPEEY